MSAEVVGEEIAQSMVNATLKAGATVAVNTPKAIKQGVKGSVMLGKGAGKGVLWVIDRILENSLKNATPKEAKYINRSSNLKKLRDSGEPLACLDISKDDVNKVMVNCKKAGIKVAKLENSEMSAILFSEKESVTVTKIVEMVVKERMAKEKELVENNKELENNEKAETKEQLPGENTKEEVKPFEYEEVGTKNESYININPKDLEQIKQACSQYDISISTYDKDGKTTIVIDTDKKEAVTTMLDAIVSKRLEKETIDNQIKQGYKELSLDKITTDLKYDTNAEQLQPKEKGSIAKNILEAKVEAKNLSSHDKENEKENVAKKENNKHTKKAKRKNKVRSKSR